MVVARGTCCFITVRLLDALRALHEESGSPCLSMACSLDLFEDLCFVDTNPLQLFNKVADRGLLCHSFSCYCFIFLFFLFSFV